MLRNLTLALLLFVTACAPVLPTPTAPVATQTAIVVTPTPIPPIRELHLVVRAMGTASVLDAWCKRQSTSILLYDWGLLSTFDDSGYHRCLEAKTI